MEASDQDFDAIVRTVYGEAGNESPEGQQAVASVILNRARDAGANPYSIVHAPGQFDAWSDPRTAPKVNSLDPNSQAYQRIAAAVQPVISGVVPDRTGGAVHFYNPNAVKTPPAWDTGGIQIGNHKFITNASSAPQNHDDLYSALTSGSPAPAPIPQAHTDLYSALTAGSPPAKTASAAANIGPAVGDFLKSAASGAVETAAGLPGDLRKLVEMGTTGAINLVSPGLGTRLAQGVANARAQNPLVLQPPSSADVASALSGVGLHHDPQGLAGDYGRTIGSFLPAAIGGEGSVLSRVARNALLPGATSEAAGQATQGTPAEPYMRFAGSLLPSAIGAGARSLIGASAISPERAALADKAINQYNIPLRGSQIYPATHPFNKYLDTAIAKIPFSGLASSNDAILSSFSREVANSIGATSPKLTPEVMLKAKTDLGSIFNRVGANTTLDASDLPTKLQGILDDAKLSVTDSELKPIENQIMNVMGKIDPKTDTISGTQYQALTRKGAPLDRGTSTNNSNINFHVGKIRDALDDALESSASGQDLADLQKARLQYKNLKTIEPLAEKATIEGEISPSLLLQAVRNNFDNFAYHGAGQLGDLGRIGQEFIKPISSSNTAENRLLYKVANAAGHVATGAGALYGAYHPQALAAELALVGGTMAGGRLIGSVLKSNAYRNALLRNATGQAAPSSAVPIGLLAAHNLLNPQTTYGQQ